MFDLMMRTGPDPGMKILQNLSSQEFTRGVVCKPTSVMYIADRV